MNKSESKYFHTAECMDEAFLKLLEKKEFPYISVKEICEKAGVNRSTFYLHYESVADLLAESVRYMNDRFLTHMQVDSERFIDKLQTCSKEELYLVTPQYLTPYLDYIRENRRLFRTAIENSAVLQLSENYDRMFRYVFTPILERFHVADEDRRYIMAFYMKGLMAIIEEWLKSDCSDDIEHVIRVIQMCVARHSGGEEAK